MSSLRTALCVPLVAMLSACATDPAADGVSAVQFQDVVVPSGLVLRDNAHESYSREEASWRRGHFVYGGQTDLQAAANYVRERMPQHSWSKMRDEQDQEAGIRLGFVRGIYRADYVFSRTDGSTLMVVEYTTDYATDPNRR